MDIHGYPIIRHIQWGQKLCWGCPIFRQARLGEVDDLGEIWWNNITTWPRPNRRWWVQPAWKQDTNVFQVISGWSTCCQTMPDPSARENLVFHGWQDSCTYLTSLKWLPEGSAFTSWFSFAITFEWASKLVYSSGDITYTLYPIQEQRQWLNGQ